MTLVSFLADSAAVALTRDDIKWVIVEVFGVFGMIAWAAVRLGRVLKTVEDLATSHVAAEADRKSVAVDMGRLSQQLDQHALDDQRNFEIVNRRVDELFTLIRRIDEGLRDITDVLSVLGTGRRRVPRPKPPKKE